jgi:predicted MFS family arabinose efflux permease
MNLKAILLLISAIGVIGANSLLLSPIALTIAADFATSGNAVMGAAAAYGIGVVISALFLAPRADRIGADKAVVQAISVLALALLLSAVIPNLTSLLIAQGVAGLAAGIALPAIYTLSAEIAPKGQEAQTIGAVLTGWTLSMVFGVTAAAVIAEHLGWRSVYGLLGLISLCLILPSV